MILKSKTKYTLHSAIQDGDIKKVKQLINKDITLVNSKYKDGTTALSVALKYKNLPIAEILLSNGANVNAQDNDGHTALHLVVDTIQVYYEFFEKYPTYCNDHIALLLKYNADVNIEDSQGNTPLSDAVECRCIEPLAIMLKHNSTGINKKYDEGETLLHIAVRNKIIDIIQLLIDYGADIDAKDDNGMTTIDYAAKSGNADVFNFLTEQSVPWY
ncbi:ankyrin [Orientia tsutsugamushi]|uniref:Ankyrin n=1 Tax=Orientia tsutsugamushi TaxID=784 RepID=A0A2U3RF34_ORITS|nr:ankyrin repeat domain-containing protein [Orientia tsutsugamushi]KJV77903.1 ankyrin repeat family protein [Orientia tsutsugamushi str. UT76]SPR11760.1 ankyrin [Orientia tsutsugamushi]